MPRRDEVAGNMILMNARRKEMVVNHIYKVIRDNPKITSKLLLSKLSIEPPLYLSEKVFMSYFTPMYHAKKILISDNDEVTMNDANL